MEGREFKEYASYLTVLLVYLMGLFIIICCRRSKEQGMYIYDILAKCPYVAFDHPALLEYHMFHNRLLLLVMIGASGFWILVYGFILIMQHFYDNIEAILPYV